MFLPPQLIISQQAHLRVRGIFGEPQQNPVIFLRNLGGHQTHLREDGWMTRKRGRGKKGLKIRQDGQVVPMVGRGRTPHPAPPRPPNSSCGPACTVLHQSHPRPRCQEHRHLSGTQTGSVEAVLSLPLPRGPWGLASLLGLPSPGDSPAGAPKGSADTATVILPSSCSEGTMDQIPPEQQCCICGTLPTPLPLMRPPSNDTSPSHTACSIK